MLRATFSPPLPIGHKSVVWQDPFLTRRPRIPLKRASVRDPLFRSFSASPASCKLLGSMLSLFSRRFFCTRSSPTSFFPSAQPLERARGRVVAFPPSLSRCLSRWRGVSPLFPSVDSFLSYGFRAASIAPSSHPTAIRVSVFITTLPLFFWHFFFFFLVFFCFVFFKKPSPRSSLPAATQAIRPGPSSVLSRRRSPLVRLFSPLLRTGPLWTAPQASPFILL